MKNIIALAAAAGLLTTAAFAAKPENPGENGMAFGHIEDKEARREAITLMQQNRVRPVTRAYMYPTDTASDARYDYDEDPWAMVLVKHKKDLVKLTAHNLDKDTEYELFYGGTGSDNSIGKATSNDEGTLSIKGAFDVDWGDYNPDGFVLKKVGGDTVLESQLQRLKGLPDEDE